MLHACGGNCSASRSRPSTKVGTEVEHVHTNGGVAERKRNTHKLPVKAEVRRAIGKAEGDTVTVRLE
ncbi:DUF1905 domain-containing protein, partial [Streptomyces hydrogenans]|uniref:DUF1905 domain-containing protein n=1 Tax=Streptomyces hydrogenans TaxID=1873719 RepID=UPI00332A2518